MAIDYVMSRMEMFTVVVFHPVHSAVIRRVESMFPIIHMKTFLKPYYLTCGTNHCHSVSPINKIIIFAVDGNIHTVFKVCNVQNHSLFCRVTHATCEHSILCQSIILL